MFTSLFGNAWFRVFRTSLWMSMPLLELISQLQRLATGAGLNAEALPAETHFHGLPRLISELGIRFRSFGGNTRSTLFLEEKKKKKTIWLLSCGKPNQITSWTLFWKLPVFLRVVKFLWCFIANFYVRNLLSWARKYKNGWPFWFYLNIPCLFSDLEYMSYIGSRISRIYEILTLLWAENDSLADCMEYLFDLFCVHVIHFLYHRRILF